MSLTNFNNFLNNREKPMVLELALSGACHRGIMYIGAFHYLEEIGLLKRSFLKKIVGTSIGSFVLACYISGYTINDLVNMILDVPFEIFKDWSSEISINLFEGITFKTWVIKCLSKYIPVNITMEEFYKKTGIEFIISIVSLNSGLIYVSHKTRPNMILHDAVIASMNIPFVFPPYITSDGSIKDIYIDGGLLDNFAIHLLGPRAFGIIPIRKETPLSDISNPFSYFLKMTELVGSLVRDLRRPQSEYIVEIYADDNDIIDFDLTKDEKITMYKFGYNSIKNSKIPILFITDFYKLCFKDVLEELVLLNLINKFDQILEKTKILNIYAFDNEIL